MNLIEVKETPLEWKGVKLHLRPGTYGEELLNALADLAEKKPSLSFFSWDGELRKWQCRNCGGYETREIEFNQDQRLRTDLDGYVQCLRCGLKDYY